MKSNKIVVVAGPNGSQIKTVDRRHRKDSVIRKVADAIRRLWRKFVRIFFR